MVLRCLVLGLNLPSCLKSRFGNKPAFVQHCTTIAQSHLSICEMSRRLKNCREKIDKLSNLDVKNVKAITLGAQPIAMSKQPLELWENLYDEATILAEFCALDTVDDEYLNDAIRVVNDLENKLYEFELNMLLQGEFDDRGCMMNIHSGVGGNDAEEWVSMLHRMYCRYASRKGYRITVIDQSKTDFGLKNIVTKIEGPFAYGYLNKEKGTHRLVRVSPFNALGKRQTSFAAVSTWPLLEDKYTVSVNLEDKDLEITCMRSGGKGGQNVNKVESAVRIRHIPTNLSVRCDRQRSQNMNRQEALRILKSKLLAIAQDQALDDLNMIRGSHVEATFGKQVRNYVFAPYKLVKDLRCDFETNQIHNFLDGNLDEVILKLLQENTKNI